MYISQLNVFVRRVLTRRGSQVCTAKMVRQRKVCTWRKNHRTEAPSQRGVGKQTTIGRGSQIHGKDDQCQTNTFGRRSTMEKRRQAWEKKTNWWI